MGCQDKYSREADATIAERFFDFATSFVGKIRGFTDKLELLNFAVGEVGQVLGCDRALIYQFLPRGDGVIVAESVETPYKSILGQLIYDPCFNKELIEPYRRGRVGAIADIYQSSMQQCHVELLKSFQVRANLVVPILIVKKPEAHLWGLLIAHQCRGPRNWHSLETKLLKNLATQVGFALHELEKKAVDRAANDTREPEELRWKEALFRSAIDSSLLGFYVVDNRTDNILYFNRRFCEIWAIEHLEAGMKSGELKNNDILPDCIPSIADLPSFIESCKPLQSEEYRATIEDEIALKDGRTIRRFSSQVRDIKDRYFGRLYLFEDITQKKQMQADLKAGERRWRYALEGNGDGVWDWNVQTDEVFFSRRWKEILGFSNREIGNTLGEWWERIHPGDRQKVDTAIQKHFRGESEYYICEHRVRCKDGTYKWILDRGKAIDTTPDGRPARMVGTHTDITDRRRMEEALKASEERYRSVVDAMKEGIVLQQSNGRIFACNKSAEIILGLTEAQMNGRTSVDPRWRAIREDGTDFPGEEHPAMVTLRTGEPLTDRIMGVHKPDGQLVWISINSQPLFDDEKTVPYAVVASFADITEKRQLEIDLRESEELFRGIFEQATVGVATVNYQGQFLTVNDRFCNLCGYAAAELKQMTYLDITHPDDRDLSLDYHRNLWSRGIFTAVDKRYLHKDGQIVWVNLTISPIYNVRGELQYAVGIAVDISDRKQAEITIRKQAERERMLNAIARHIRQSLDLDRILQTTVDEVRKFLETDRVIIYCLNPDWSGVVVTESVVPEYLAILNMKITDSYFVETEGGNYHDSQSNNVPDIYNMGFNDCHIELLERLQVRAKLVVPIFQDSRTWGLLIAHHCRSPRRWEAFEMQLLEQLATQVAIAIRQAELHRELQLKNQELENLVLVDELTQIPNRRCFDRTLNHEWWRSLRQKTPLSIILFDIDYFKQYNDSYGHLVGDECLKIVARTLRAAARRESDLVARYGGEEFVMILPDTDSGGALKIARYLRRQIHALNLPHIGSQIASHLTLSMGVATRIPTVDRKPFDLLNAADAALYRAKEGGRDRFFICGQ